MDDVNRGEILAAMNEMAAWTALSQAPSAYVSGIPAGSDHLDLEVQGLLRARFAATVASEVRMILPEIETDVTRPLDQAVELAQIAVDRADAEPNPHLDFVLRDAAAAIAEHGFEAALRRLDRKEPA